MEFQIKENYGNGCGGYEYFTATGNESLKELKNMAINKIKVEWGKNKSSSFIMHSPTPPNPTIHVVEYDSETNKKVKGGISFKTKWR
jgi:hypothetical protein